MTPNTFDPSAVIDDPTATLQTFHLDDLAQFKHEGRFDPADASDYRAFYVGRDNVHAALAYLLAHCSQSFKFNMFGYDDDELDSLIQHMLRDKHVFVQGTLDKSQSGGVHERAIIAGWNTKMRNSFAIGQSATHQISHTKGGVLDGLVAFEGSTNWSVSGEGTLVPGKPLKAQNNTLLVHTNPIEVQAFSIRLDEEHVNAIHQQQAQQAKLVH